MNYTEAKLMKEWSMITKDRKIKLDWKLPQLNIMIEKDGKTQSVPLSIVVDAYIQKLEGLQ